jgi:hypothetical protein
MAVPNQQQRRFIVMALAKFNSPSEVVRMVKTEYGLDTYRQYIQSHDPTTEAGQSLSVALRKLFYDTRKQFIEDEAQPFSHKSVKLDRIDKLYQQALDAGNAKMVARAIGLAIAETKQVTAGAEADGAGSSEAGNELWEVLIRQQRGDSRGDV